MLTPKTCFLTLLSMLAFAGNSLLCRLALKQTSIDAASFTSLRLVSGAIALYLIVLLRNRQHHRGTLLVAAGSAVTKPLQGAAGSWTSALALFGYAGAFSFAYVSLAAGTGALLLFGTVQTCMVGYGLVRGERFSRRQLVGLACAFGGLVWLLLPGAAAPPLAGASLMIVAGISWAVYSLRGKGATDPAAVTAGNFLRAAPLALALSLGTIGSASFDSMGLSYALLSGIVASGIGYVIWYAALSGLPATIAATTQSSVPVLAALGGVALLGESITMRLVLASVAILGGVAVVISHKPVVT